MAQTNLPFFLLDQSVPHMQLLAAWLERDWVQSSEPRMPYSDCPGFKMLQSLFMGGALSGLRSEYVEALAREHSHREHAPEATQSSGGSSSTTAVEGLGGSERERSAAAATAGEDRGEEVVEVPNGGSRLGRHSGTAAATSGADCDEGVPVAMAIGGSGVAAMTNGGPVAVASGGPAAVAMPTGGSGAGVVASRGPVATASGGSGAFAFASRGSGANVAEAVGTEGAAGAVCKVSHVSVDSCGDVRAGQDALAQDLAERTGQSGGVDGDGAREGDGPVADTVAGRNAVAPSPATDGPVANTVAAGDAVAHSRV